MRQRHEKIDDLDTTTAKFLSLQQLAEVLNVARRTLYYHAEKGALRVVKRGGVRRVPIAEARRYASAV